MAERKSRYRHTKKAKMKSKCDYLIISFEQSANFQQAKICKERKKTRRLHAFKVVEQYLNRIETNWRIRGNMKYTVKQQQTPFNFTYNFTFYHTNTSYRHTLARAHTRAHTIYQSTLYQNHTALYEIWSANRFVFNFFFCLYSSPFFDVSTFIDLQFNL